jgi:hypothetical protein
MYIVYCISGAPELPETKGPPAPKHTASTKQNHPSHHTQQQPPPSRPPKPLQLPQDFQQLLQQYDDLKAQLGAFPASCNIPDQHHSHAAAAVDVAAQGFLTRLQQHYPAPSATSSSHASLAVTSFPQQARFVGLVAAALSLLEVKPATATSMRCGGGVNGH